MKTENPREDLAAFGHIGIGALLQGMVFARELLDRRIEELKAELAATMNGAPQLKRGRPPGTKNTKQANGAATFWNNLTPEQRAAEAQHRHNVRMGLEPPRDPKAGTPSRRSNLTPEQRSAQARIGGLARWGKKPTPAITPKGIKKISSYQKTLWANYTPEQRAERIAKALKGRKAAAKRKAA